MGEVRANERVAYHNGRYVPEGEVTVPFRDRGFLYGDAVFDTPAASAIACSGWASTWSGSTARYAICGSTGAAPAELAAVTEEVFARNRHCSPRTRTTG